MRNGRLKSKMAIMVISITFLFTGCENGLQGSTIMLEEKAEMDNNVNQITDAVSLEEIEISEEWETTQDKETESIMEEEAGKKTEETEENQEKTESVESMETKEQIDSEEVVQDNTIKVQETISVPGFDVKKVLEEAENKNRELQKRLQEDDSLTQTDMNQMASERYQLWDDILNDMWKVLKTSLDKEKMNNLLKEQKAWITHKEEQVEVQTKEFEGGSMSALVAGETAADLTRKRVYELAAYFGYEALP